MYLGHPTHLMNSGSLRYLLLSDGSLTVGHVDMLPEFAVFVEIWQRSVTISRSIEVQNRYILITTRLPRKSACRHCPHDKFRQVSVQSQYICWWESLLVKIPFCGQYTGCIVYVLIETRSILGYSLVVFCSYMTRFSTNLVIRTWRGERGEEWSSAQGLESILISIQSLMSSNPYENEPGFENASQEHDQENMKAYVLKVCFQWISLIKQQIGVDPWACNRFVTKPFEYLSFRG